MNKLRFALFGTGFWARFQLHGWLETGGVECVAVYNRTRSKAEAFAREFNIPAIYDDAETLLKHETLDFVDICTNVETHAPLTTLAIAYKLPVVCQKPLGTTLAEATDMVTNCREQGVPLFVNENWRWQYPIRQFKHMLDTGRIGKPFRARIDMISGFPVFKNQPFLADLEQFILTDLGSHTLDTARCFFGEANTLYCQTQRVHPNIKGEDVATIMMNMGDDVTVLVEMAYAENYLEREIFPQTLIFVEGSKGSLELASDFWIRETTADGTLARRYPPPRYPWADPAYDVVHSSIVACQANILEGLRGGAAETTGEDNLKTVQLVFASYDSAAARQAILF
ncbi:MAG: Gfo/Idh/MocA family oxidoreductase [Chloroflexota bacterium]|nr:Gfo/Idh/MocA family oxidoreductase [Chloroflexota bacterium]